MNLHPDFVHQQASQLIAERIAEARRHALAREVKRGAFAKRDETEVTVAPAPRRRPRRARMADCCAEPA